MIVEWAKDPSRVVEEYSSTVKRWFVVQSPDWHPACQYRFKPAEPKFIVVNGVYVPVPVRESLTDEQTYWLADPTLHYVKSGLWTADTTELHWLSLGLIHLTREAAQAHIDAMLLPSRSDK
jgi:hypothetical protein